MSNRRFRRFLCWAGFHQRLKTTYPWGQDYYCTHCGHKSYT